MGGTTRGHGRRQRKRGEEVKFRYSTAASNGRIGQAER
jgi:hypothetical protein